MKKKEEIKVIIINPEIIEDIKKRFTKLMYEEYKKSSRESGENVANLGK